MKKALKLAAVAMIALPGAALAGSPAPVIVEADPFVEAAPASSLGSMGGGAIALGAALAVAALAASNDS